jgi:hypothetical protein
METRDAGDQQARPRACKARPAPRLGHWRRLDETQLLHEIVPKPAKLALLANPNNPNAEPDTKGTQAAAQTLGRELRC